MLCFFIGVIFLQSSHPIPKNRAKVAGKGLLDSLEILECHNACWGPFTACFWAITTPKEDAKCIQDRDQCISQCKNCHKNKKQCEPKNALP